MKIVVDTSVIISVLVDEIEKSKIIEKTIGCELVAPFSVNWEIGNAISSLIKRKKINLSQIDKFLDLYNHIPILFLGIDLKFCMGICWKFNIYAYDAYVIAVAYQNNLPIFSLDKRIIEISKFLKLNVIEV